MARKNPTNAERLQASIYHLVAQYGYTNILDGIMNACTLEIYRGGRTNLDLRVLQDMERKLQALRNETARYGL